MMRMILGDVIFVPGPAEILLALLPVLAVIGLVILCAAVGIILVQKKRLKAQEEKRKASLLQKEKQAGLNVIEGSGSEKTGNEMIVDEKAGSEGNGQADEKTETETGA
ncbi:MAG: hypothetical protein IJL98_06700 [Lachnospiraceae bacterium]|nr:hypothetical protein [Lachnospiraceae bacterium]